MPWAQYRRKAWVGASLRLKVLNPVRVGRGTLRIVAPLLMKESDERLDVTRVSLLVSPMVRDLCAECSSCLPSDRC